MNLNSNQCRKVISQLHTYYKDFYSLAEIAYPQSIPFRSNEYYLYMFYSCLLDYGMRSKIYHQNLIEAYQKYPQLFSPKAVLTMEECEIKEILVKNVHPRYPNVALKKWINLSKQLMNYEDISEHLKKITSATELYDFIKSIKGYGQKTGGLLIRIITDSSICHFKEEMENIPIDRHDIEISYLTGVVDTMNLNLVEIKSLSSFYIQEGKKQKISPSSIDKYL